MPGQTDGQPDHAAAASGRSCGPCRACCKCPPIPVFDKPANVWCPHISLDKSDLGCSIYDSRPVGCRSFVCGWMAGMGEPEDRPDKLGVMWQIVTKPDGTEALGLVEYRPGALADERNRAYLERFASGNPGRVFVRRADEADFRGVSLTVERSTLPGDAHAA